MSKPATIQSEPIGQWAKVAGQTDHGQRGILAAIPVLLLILSLPDLLQAAAGDLDPGFDGDGKVTTDFAASNDSARAVAIQADGKMVVAGSSTVPGFFSDFALARYNPDGSLDTSFSVDGKVTTDFAAANDSAAAVAIQADGKIVVAGSANTGATSDFALARYNPDGSLDTSFDGDGRVTTDFAAVNDYAGALAIQTDGKIVVAGGTNTGAASNFALARYNPDGSLDSNFDGDGKVTADFAAAYDFAHAVAIQADGKIVVAGDAFVAPGDADFALARYNPDGSLDSSFDGDGKVTTNFFGAGNYDFAIAATIQPNGRIVVAGTAYMGLYSNFALARYNPNGSLDTSFDGDGKVTTDFAAGDDWAYAVAVQADARIVAAGYAFTNPYNDFALARYNPNGSLDTSFSYDGKVTTDFAASDDFASALAIQADGKMVAVGYANTGGASDFALARYDGDQSDLSIAKTDSPDPVDAGQNLTYTITVTNNGPGLGSAVTMTDSLPAGISLVSATPSQGACTGTSTVTCSLGSLGNGATVMVVIVVMAITGGTVSNTAGVSSTTPDPNLANNTATEDTLINQNCLFCDDFEDGILAGNWDYQKPSWTESGGNLIGTPSGRKAFTVANPAFAGCSLCSIETSLATAGGSFNKLFFYGWYQDKKNTVVVLMKQENNKFVLKQVVGGVTVQKTKGLATLLPNVFYDVMVTFDGANFTLIVDGNTLATMPAALPPVGTVGYAVKNTVGSFGFVSVN